MNKTRLTVIAIAAVLSLSLVSAASADTFCVHSPVACVGTPAGTLNAALQSAKTNGAGTRDTIRVGPGAFADLPATIDLGNPVDIVGASATTTVLSTNGNGVIGIRMFEPSATLSQLQVQIAGSGSELGIELAGQADHIAVTTTGTQTGVTGIAFEGTKGALRHSSVSLSHTPDQIAYGVLASAGREATIEDSSIDSVWGVNATGAVLDVRRTRIWAQRGVAASNGGYLHISDSSIQVPGRQYSNWGVYALSTGGAVGAVIVGDRVTAYGNGSPGSKGVYMSPNDVAGIHDYVTLENTVLTGFADDAWISGGTNAASTFTTTYSAYRFADAIPQTGGVHNGLYDVNLTGIDPGFGGEGPVPLKAGSPLVDAGNPGFQLPQEIDAYKQPRLRDGDGIGGARVDIGAFEYQRAAPVVTATATPDSVAPGTPVSFTGSATDADMNDELTFAWTFDGSVDVAPGMDVQRSFTAPGPHTATLTVTDSAGVSTETSVHVTVNAPPAPATAPDATPAPVVVPGPPAATERIAPRLTGLRLSRTTFRARGARTSAASRSIRIGTTARFSASEPVRLTLTVQRRKGGRWVSVGRLVSQRGAGRGSVRLDGRIKRRPLAAGRYRLRAVARDADGMTSAASVARFRVVR